MHDLTQQFEFENSASKRLLAANTSERPALYLSIYDEFYQRFGFLEHSAESNSIGQQVAFFRRFIGPGTKTVVEIGCGSGHLCIALAPLAPEVIGIDAAENKGLENIPSNCRFLVADVALPFLTPNSADLIISNQVLEHLHPDDCIAVMKNAFAVLKHGGMFVNTVPNWITGPHDVSKHFAKRACGLHLHEYDNREFAALLRQAGFVDCVAYVGKNKKCFPLPSGLVALAEFVLAKLPSRFRKNILVRGMVGIRSCARKP